MTPETPTASADQNVALVDTIVQRAAREATTAREFQRQMTDQLRALLGTESVDALPPALAQEIERRRDLIEKALADADGARLEDHAPEVGGTNVIGGGTAGMTLNRERVAEVKDEANAKEVETIVQHEKAHGESVQLQGELLPGITGTTRGDVRLLLYEGYAEVKANEQTGERPDAHREGQPKEVYREGQDLVMDLIRRTSREDVEALMTGHGDLYRFQRELIERQATLQLAA